MRNLHALLFGLAIALTSGGATDCGQIIDDAGFDLWCGDRLCRWTLEKGAIAPTATWHSGDDGVDMIGAEVALSQLTEVAANDGTCIAFDLVADVAADAEVTLEVDVYGDGTVDHVERIPTSDWRPISFRLAMPERYQGVRFRLRKLGGHAVLANIGAEIAPERECVGARLVAGPAPDGAQCRTAADCASGFCVPGPFGSSCGGCAVDSDCGGELCALDPIAPAHLGLPTACTAAASTPTALACIRDEQCASGRCVDNVCSTCAGDRDCNGGSCLAIVYTWPDGGTAVGGHFCASGAGAASGAPCLTDGECASGQCQGTAHGMCRTSFFPRACDVDSDCPGFAFTTEPACVTVGIRGGTCQ